jgi:two-component system, LytTR family, sensor histidine kinase AlgZ
MPSIRQTAYPDVLPDFRNLAVVARILVAVNGLALAGALYATSSFMRGLESFVYVAAFLEPLLLVQLIALYVASTVVSRLSYWSGCAAVVGIAVVLTALYHTLVRAIAMPALPSLGRTVALTILVAGFLLAYFYLHTKAFSPALAEARLQALQARIRPHFLFNSMNTIASLTRSDPVLAEQAVQDLADLFRASLGDQRQTISLAEELEVARTYQRIEELRLGPRLHVSWNVERLPADARVPGLLLQPLIENAIYHGIEPRPEGGTVSIVGEVAGDLITIVVRNPVDERESDREGNRLALANIRERLSLLYGELALVKAGRFDREYIVTLRFPHVTAVQ